MSQIFWSYKKIILVGNGLFLGKKTILSIAENVLSVRRSTSAELHTLCQPLRHVSEVRPQLGVRESVPDLPNGSSQLREVLRLLEGRDPVLHDRPHVEREEMPDQAIAVHVPVVDNTLPSTFDGERTSSLPC